MADAADAARAIQAAQQAAETAEQAGDLDRALGYFRALQQIEPANHRWHFEAARVLRSAGRDGDALEAVRTALRRWPNALTWPDVQAILPEAARVRPGRSDGTELAGRAPSDAALKRPPVDDDGARDFSIAEGGRKTAVLVFTGLADRMVMPLPVFDRYLAELDLTAIYLRDKKRIGFFNGVASLGETYEETTGALKALLAERGIREVHTLGNSAGGMAAVSYGIDLGVRSVLAFSSPVALVAGTKDVDFRTAVFADRILHGVSEERRDFRRRLDAAESPPEIRLYYGADMPEDAYHAAFLEGRPGVRLHPLKGMAGHGALFRLARNGELRTLFREVYGES